MDDSIPLFPLNTLLFPKGRLSLQIFESRYLDLVSRCLKTQTGFGVVLIEQGSEVARPGMKLDIHRVGTYAEIVDWNQLPSGLLGITVEGRKTFRILESWRQSDDLCLARVAFREEDATSAAPAPVAAIFDEYVELLKGLARHPAIEEMRLDIDFDNLREVAWRLSELLPISNLEKQGLLELADPYERLELIEDYITSLNQ